MTSEYEKVCLQFQREWSSGRKAKLTLTSQGGRAQALLELSLGRASGPGRGGGGPRPRKRPPSYKRRQEARKAARKRTADQVSPNDTTKASEEVVTTAAQVDGSKDAENVVIKETAGLAAPTTADAVTTHAVQVDVSTVAVPKNATNAAEDVTTSAVQADASAAAAAEFPVMSRVDLDKADTAELAAVVLDVKELVRRREVRLKTLYKRSQNAGKCWYRCLVCSNQRVKWRFQQEGSETNFLADIEYHITSEHWDTYSNEVEAEMRRGGGPSSMGGVLQDQLQAEKGSYVDGCF